MKRLIICICLILLFVSSNASTQQLGEKVYKEVIVDGQKVNRWIETVCIAEYDDKGDIIHSKFSSGEEYWYEYDAKGNLIHEKWPDDEFWYEYDAKGNLIHEKLASGSDIWYEYDAKGNKIRVKDSNGVEIVYKYDVKGNIIYEKRSEAGDEWWYEYDKYGTIIHEWTSDGYESKTVCKYDKNGKLIYSKSNVKPIGSPERIDEWWYEYNADGTIEHGICKDISEYYIHYNKNGNIIYHKSKAWYEDVWDELWCEFDANGNKVFEKGKYGECHYKYDERNNLIYAKWINDLESWYEYEYYNDGTKKTCKKYTTFLGLDD